MDSLDSPLLIALDSTGAFKIRDGYASSCESGELPVSCPAMLLRAPPISPKFLVDPSASPDEVLLALSEKEGRGDSRLG